ncbi:hypothetical protein P153DRAFT_420675 [Dothidotthia symphoricarpi CBS 119687]|uniref:MGS207 protein n=1 Tax=Dothidotthia symphoricarpi CBS 119687 TaxID=1392245 RepID=A0A6A6ALQ0_9PLEO|nr:uncharacterized protein P153DRAFT_420675 [Dothidotthia symphoricarpi CBS 119687]KAF2132730.1 hypothetical protein P153DRAFT_420675 [Dothidotthia symphoricarpi CBS 119687]
MFNLPRISLPSFLRFEGGNHPAIHLPSVEIHDTETAAEKRPRTLKHLLKANHANYSIIYNDLRFHNHTPHILGSAYLLGATAEHLNDIYEKEAEVLEPWHDSPGEISKEDWREFLGKREYQRAFVDFFEDQLVATQYHLTELLDEFLLGGKEPLINGLVSGLAHPLIHLGYAYELDSITVTIEALALAACFYSPLHKYIDDPAYTRPSPRRSTSLLDLLNQVREDKRFDGLYDHRSGDTSRVFEEREDALLEYWNAWDLSDPKEQFHASQDVAVALLVGTEAPEDTKFDFFFVHLLTSSHAVRILLPLVPAKFHLSLVRQWWLFTLAVYVAQTRPRLDVGRIDGYELKGRNWKFVMQKALNGPNASDAHFVKALRSLKVAEETWGESSQYYLKAAVKFAEEFEHWGGFGTEEDEARTGYAGK